MTPTEANRAPCFHRRQLRVVNISRVCVDELFDRAKPKWAARQSLVGRTSQRLLAEMTLLANESSRDLHENKDLNDRHRKHGH